MSLIAAPLRPEIDTPAHPVGALPRSRRSPAPERLTPGDILYVEAAAGGALIVDIVLHDAGADTAAWPAGCYREVADSDPESVARRLRTLAGDGWRIVRLIDATAATPVAAELSHLAEAGFRTTPCSDAVAFVAHDFAGAAPSPREAMVAFTGLAG